MLVTMAAARGELLLVHRIRERVRRAAIAGRAVQLGIGDDCAILRPPPGRDLLVTTDFSLEGRHFRRDWHPPRSVGHRCLARGLSDLAAMGATPLSAFLSLALPAGMSASATGRRWIEGFLDGLLDLAEHTGTPLSGGDTAAAPGKAILGDIVLVGAAPRGQALRRSGARPGDGLFVTGALGGAAAEWHMLQARPARYRQATEEDGTHPHLFPAPRLRVGQALLRQGIAAAAIDLSDGLSTDLAHLCAESHAGAVVDAAALPVHPLARALDQEKVRSGGQEKARLNGQEKARPGGNMQALPASLQAALHGGEDYELLFTARPGQKVPRRIGNVAITRIGEIVQGKSVHLRTAGRTRLLRPAGWEHDV